MKDLAVLFAALDTLLSLHFASSITIPKVHDLCQRATQLTKKRVDLSTLELILTLDPHAYQIIHFGPESIDYGVCAPKGISPLRFGTLLPLRRKAFEELISSAGSSDVVPFKLSHFAQASADTDDKTLLPLNGEFLKSKTLPMSSLTYKPSSNLKKVHKPSSSKNHSNDYGTDSRVVSRLSVCDLKNSLVKFTLKKQTYSGGLSLIERIKLKEGASCHALDEATSKKNHFLYIKSKALAVYDILYELSIKNKVQQNNSRIVPIEKLVSMIKDSFSFAMTEDDIKETLEVIVSLLPERMNLVGAGKVHAIKIGSLNRNSDISVLRSV